MRKPKVTFKQNIRALGIDDGFFRPHSDKITYLIGVLYRADDRLEGILCTPIEVDGLNSTRQIISMVKHSRFSTQPFVLFLSGINFAGFNIADIRKLYQELNIPIIVTFRKHPNFNSIRAALKRFKDFKKRVHLIERAGAIYPSKKILFQCWGMDEKTAASVIEKFSKHSHLPEPVRLAHMIASGITLGHSTRAI